MSKLSRDFVSEESREYKFKIGTVVASSLTGFIAGFIVASIIFSVLMTLLKINNI